MRFWLVLFLVFGGLGVSASAQEQSEVVAVAAAEAEETLPVQTPLAVGESIPEDFMALDGFSRQTGFEALKGDKGLVLLFVRSADWCQYCKAELKAWNAQADAVKAAGYGLASLSYDSPETIQKFADLNKVSFTMLSDEASNVINRFGIRNEKFAEGSRFYGIPNPAIYVFDAKGIVKHVFREESYQDRPEISQVMDALKATAAK